MADDIIEGAARATDPVPRTFETLDGLRGVAAVMVMIWHAGARPYVPSAYLAVDLFFMLSGFVLAYRYDARLGSGLSGRDFLIMRVIRLYPLYLLGTLIGALFALWLTAARTGHYGFWAERMGLALIGVPVLARDATVFPYNVPAWSLFYELIVNAVFGFTNRRLPRKAIVAIVAAAGAALVVTMLHYGNMRFTGRMPRFLFGSLRAIFGFYVGVLIHGAWARGALPRWRVPPMLILAGFVLLLFAPSHGAFGETATAAIVFAGLPLTIALGIGNEPAGSAARVMTALGLLSFPLYAVHYPILRLSMRIARDLHLPAGAGIAAGLILSLIVAALALRFYDAPVRRRLSSAAARFFRR